MSTPAAYPEEPGRTPPPPFVANPPDLLILDVDGVLTDNTIWLDGAGQEQKRFFVPDGTGVHLLRRAEVPVALETLLRTCRGTPRFFQVVTVAGAVSSSRASSACHP